MAGLSVRISPDLAAAARLIETRISDVKRSMNGNNGLGNDRAQGELAGLEGALALMLKAAISGGEA